MSTVDLSERDNKETLFVKEEGTNDAEVFREVVVDVEVSQREPSSSVLLMVSQNIASTCLRVGKIVISKNVRVIKLGVLPDSCLRTIIKRNVNQVRSGGIIGRSGVIIG